MEIPYTVVWLRIVIKNIFSWGSLIFCVLAIQKLGVPLRDKFINVLSCLQFLCFSVCDSCFSAMTTSLYIFHVVKGRGKVVEYAKFQVVPEIKLLG